MKDKEIFNGFVALVKPSKGHEPYFQAETLVLSNLKPQTPVEQRGQAPPQTKGYSLLPH